MFPEFENLVGNLIIGIFVIGFFEKLFLEFLQSFVNAISGILLSDSDYLCNVLLELRLVGGLITKERVDSLNYHILQYHLCLFRIDDEISICILGVAEEVIVIYLYLAILVAKLESQLHILAEGL